MKYPATQRWPMPPSTGSCATPTVSRSKAKACASSGCRMTARIHVPTSMNAWPPTAMRYMT